MRAFLVSAATAAAVVAIGGHVGLTEWLGAHPLWSLKVAYLGIAVGLSLAVLAALARLRAGATGLAGAALLVAAGLVAGIGKARFAASYAEDALAGRMWFLGWIAAAAGCFVVVFAAMSALGGASSDTQKSR